MQALSSSSSPGPVLRRVREDRGLSLSEVARSTRIESRYLALLEEDASLEEYPAPVYARFFLREYAGHLGLSERELLASFDTRFGPVPQPEPVAPIEIRRPRRWPRRVLTAILAFGLVAGASAVGWAYVVRRGEPAAIDRSPQRIERTYEVPPPGRRVEPPATGAGVQTIHAVLEVREACWVRAKTDGELVAERVIERGDSIALEAERKLVLHMGNAAGVDLRVNGERIPTSTVGVLYLTFVVQDGRVVAY
jgi:transcriptional regulator with XRE-family HTH domain